MRSTMKPSNTFMPVTFGVLCAVLYSSLGAADVARADIAVIVNIKNQSTWAVDSREQVKAIFLGKLDKFTDGTSIKAVDQKHGATRDEFYKKVTGKDEGALNTYWAKQIFTGNGQPPKTVGGDEDVKNVVKENPGSIGYVDSHAVDSSVKVIYTIK